MFDIQPTEEVKAMQDLNSMASHSQFALEQLIDYSTHAYRAFWYGEASPAVKLTMLGTQALAVFTLHQQTQAFIQLVHPAHEIQGIPEGYSIAWNQDGSGVLTEPE